MDGRRSHSLAIVVIGKTSPIGRERTKTLAAGDRRCTTRNDRSTRSVQSIANTLRDASLQCQGAGTNGLRVALVRLPQNATMRCLIIDHQHRRIRAFNIVLPSINTQFKTEMLVQGFRLSCVKLVRPRKGATMQVP
jgi:hypothetical protein